jgi:hypothetical protein
MPLMVTRRCCCIRSASGVVLALCSRCRARVDPEFARRCTTEFNQKPPAPHRKKARTVRNRKEPRP